MKFSPDKLNAHDLAIEDPEKETKEGRDPETFLPEMFDWVEKQEDVNSNRRNWSFDVLENGFIDMQVSFPVFPEKLIDENIDVSEKFIRASEGMNELFTILNNKRVISINDRGRWLLKIIDNKPRKDNLQTEAPAIPEQKQF